MVNMEKLEMTPPWNDGITSVSNHSDNTTVLPNLQAIKNNACPIDDVVFTLVMNGFIIGLLCVFGIVGNSLSILVLQKDANHKVAIFLLQSLAVADNLLLVVSFVALSIWKGILPYIYEDEDSLRRSMVYIPVIINPLGAMTQTATVWLTVLLALNRYLAVCRPFQAPLLCTLKRVKIQVGCVTLFSVFFNFPRFFQFNIIDIIISKVSANGTIVNTSQLSLEPTVIGHSTMFGIVYTNALYSLLVLLLPLIFLIVLNTQLLRELRTVRRRSRRASMRGLPTPSDDNISYIMIIIIVVFIVCQTPDRIFQIFALLLFKGSRCSITKERLRGFCNLLVIINSSTNFVIYYLFRKSFRKILKQRICGFHQMSTYDSSIGKPVTSVLLSEISLDTETKHPNHKTTNNGTSCKQQNGSDPDVKSENGKTICKDVSFTTSL